MTDTVVSRGPTPGDAIDGVLPGRVIEPHDAAGFAAVLADATSTGRSTVLRGAGTKTAWGRPPVAVGQALSTSRLLSPLIHRDGDLTATVGAGVRLADLNTQLSQKGQWLPVESAFAGTTVGGLVATNESGPLRHRFGTPRDLLIGVTLALPDGRVVKSGGTVVKNVAGYDLGRLICGSMGTLAAVVEATFKLAPLAPSSATMELRCDSVMDLASAYAALSSSPLEPAAFDLRLTCAAGQAPVRQLFVRFATSPRALATQGAALMAAVPGFAPAAPDSEAGIWRDQLTLPWQGAATVRCSWSPAGIADVVELLESNARELRRLVLTGRAAVGAGFVQLDGDAAAQASVIRRLRQSPALSHVVLLGATPELKALVDVWGDPVPWARPLAALKQTLDPAGILGAGRGPI
jgi:glycolate oxidase FAD binding subunit